MLFSDGLCGAQGARVKVLRNGFVDQSVLEFKNGKKGNWLVVAWGMSVLFLNRGSTKAGIPFRPEA